MTAQKTYVRVSESDCINCYSGFFSPLFNSSLKDSLTYLFEEKFEGQRFDNFNKLYFQGNVDIRDVVFSDSLYQLTEPILNNFSGLVLINNGKVLSSMAAEEIGKSSVGFPDYLSMIFKTNKVFNMKVKGLSSRIKKGIDFNSDRKIIIDNLYNMLYFEDNKGDFVELDLKSDVFQEVLEVNLKKNKFDSHLKHKEILKKIGKYNPSSFSLLLTKDILYLSYWLSYIIEESDGNTTVYNLPVISINNIGDGKLSVKKIVENSIVNDFEKSEFDVSAKYNVYHDKIYYLNYVKYSKENMKKNYKFPLFSIVKLNESATKYKGYSDELKNFKFQEDTLLNSKYIMDIEFLSKEEHILLRYMPYAVNLDINKKYLLDWDEKINDIRYPPRLDYKNIQFWQKEEDFVVLVKYKDAFLLKTYDKTWNLKKEQELPFNAKAVEDIRFTQKHVYLFTENELLEMPNVFEE